MGVPRMKRVSTDELDAMGDQGELAGLRYEIDEIDKRLLAALNERARVAIAIGDAKQKAGITKAEVHSPSRELTVLERLRSMNTGPLPNTSVQAIYREIMSASASLQQELTVGYLGPAGTFCHQSALTSFGHGATLTAFESIADVVRAVDSNTVMFGVVPWENSGGGIVTNTLDELSSFSGHVRAQTFVPVRHALLSKCAKERVRRIYSRPEALEQCDEYIKRMFPNAELVCTSSTAAAAKAVSTDQEGAAIASRICAEQYGLDILDEPVNDDINNATRFFVLGKQCDVRAERNHSLVSFAADPRQRCALSEAFGVFRVRQIHVVRIDSRPIKSRPWFTRYFVEFCGHLTDQHVIDAIHMLHRWCVELRVLGSFADMPRPDGCA